MYTILIEDKLVDLTEYMASEEEKNNNNNNTQIKNILNNILENQNVLKLYQPKFSEEI